MGSGASSGQVDKNVAHFVLSNLDSGTFQDEVLQDMQGSIFSTMYCLAKKKKAPKALMDAIDDQLEEVGWVDKAGEEAPEALLEVCQELGVLEGGLGELLLTGVAGGAAASGGAALPLLLPIMLLYGLTKWLKKSEKKLSVADVRKEIQANEVKKLTAELMSAMENFESIPRTPKLEGRKNKVDKGDGMLMEAINHMITQLRDARNQPDGFTKAQFELFSRLQFAICARLVSLKLQQELKSDNHVTSFNAEREKYAMALKELCVPYCKYRMSQLSMEYRGPQFVLSEAVLLQDRLKGTFLWANPEGRYEPEMWSGILKKGQVLDINQSLMEEMASKSQAKALISQKSNDPVSLCGSFIEARDSWRQLYGEWVKQDYLKAVEAQMSTLFWA